MVATTFAALKDKQDPLVMAALDWTVYLHKWSPGASYIPADLTDSSGVLQAFSDSGWRSAGEIAEKAGVEISADANFSNVRGYGSPGPRIILPTEETFGIDFTAQEWRKIIMEMVINTDMTAVTATPGKGFKVRKTSTLNIEYYSAGLVAKYGTTSAPLYPFFKFAKCMVSKRGNISGQSGQAIEFPLTLTPLDDAQWGGVFDFGVAGNGFDSVATSAGFAAAATTINVTPATQTLAVGEQVQLLVLDNNGFDRTAEVAWTTSNAARATVTPSGRVTAVATGAAATITATLGGLTDTSVITVS